MAGVEGIGVIPGKGIMIAMNHRLVNTVVNRCTMLADGDRLVPGLRKARALRVWAGVRPLWQDDRSGEQVQDTRDVSRTHAVVDHSVRDGTRGLLTMSGGKVTTLRLMAKDLGDEMCKQKGEERPCRTADVRPPGNESG